MRTRGHAGTTSNKQMLGVGRRAAVRVSERLVAQARSRAQERVCGQDERVGERTGWERGRAKDLPTWRMKMMIAGVVLRASLRSARRERLTDGRG